MFQSPAPLAAFPISFICHARQIPREYLMHFIFWK